MSELTLPAHVDLDAAQAIKDATLAAAAEETQLKLKADQVATLSAPALQTTIAAQRHMADAGQALVIVAPSEPFLAAFEGLGFYAELMKATFEE